MGRGEGQGDLGAPPNVGVVPVRGGRVRFVLDCVIVPGAAKIVRYCRSNQAIRGALGKYFKKS